MGRSRDIAEMLSKTELANTGNERLVTEFAGVDSAYVTTNTPPALSFLNTLDSLPVTSLVAGQQAYVSANNRLYISDGSGWYNKALITLTPTMTLDPTGVITLSSDGVTTSTVTVVATDSDTPGDGLTYSVDSDGNGIGKYVISQDSSVFTIRPLSADSGATTGTFTLTFSTTDGDNIATDSADFSLTFVTTIDSSAPTVLLMKASGSGKANEDISYQSGSNVILDNISFTTTQGTPVSSSFSPFREGGYSLYFDANAQYLNPKTALDGFTSTTDPFTIEFWIYNTKSWTNSYPTPIGLSRSSDGYNSFLWGNTTANDAIWFNNDVSSTAFSSDLQPNEWTHVALVYTGTQISAYYNGTQVLAPVTLALGTALSACEFGIGAEFDGANGGSPGNYFRGYMSDIRVSDIARYTSAFTPPTEQLSDDGDTVFLLSNGNPYLVDASGGAALNITGPPKYSPFGPYDSQNAFPTPGQASYEIGSTFLSTAADGVEETTNHQTISNFGSGDFTIEMWYYPTGLVNYQTLYSGRANTSTYGQLIWLIRSDGGFLAYASSTGSSWNVIAEAGTTLKVNDYSWNHLAFVRNGNNYTVYVNGVGEVVSTNGGTLVNNTRTGIGYDHTNANSQQSGYISDYRIVKGTAVYTSDFTPPTEKLSWITNTTLQMQNRYDLFVYDAAGANKFLMVADAQTSTAQRKFNTSSSVYLDGTGDYIDTDDTDLFAFGTGDFTWEMWIYHTAYEPAYLLEFGTGGDLGIHHATAEGHLTYYTSTTGISSTLYTTGFGSMSVNTWYHIAAVRNGGTTYLYKNGVLQTSAADTTDFGIVPLRCRIGAYGPNGTYPWTGYIQDLRISKGYARYTSAFTPPTAEFEL